MIASTSNSFMIDASCAYTFCSHEISVEYPCDTSRSTEMSIAGVIATQRTLFNVPAMR